MWRRRGGRWGQPAGHMSSWNREVSPGPEAVTHLCAISSLVYMWQRNEVKQEFLFSSPLFPLAFFCCACLKNRNNLPICSWASSTPHCSLSLQGCLAPPERRLSKGVCFFCSFLTVLQRKQKEHSDSSIKGPCKCLGEIKALQIIRMKNIISQDVLPFASLADLSRLEKAECPFQTASMPKLYCLIFKLFRAFSLLKLLQRIKSNYRQHISVSRQDPRGDDRPSRAIPKTFQEWQASANQAPSIIWGWCSAQL